ncbi:uncharacterized protein J3D65DRAFT_313599 [Phyllosticta citribraziliensis]|uniref:Uncharacterized protein n=1 Tax=Phyllosticta citribraziliensis TaxID=989973 RepID=A0ABR1LU47_9PEZI
MMNGMWSSQPQNEIRRFIAPAYSHRNPCFLGRSPIGQPSGLVRPSQHPTSASAGPIYASTTTYSSHSIPITASAALLLLLLPTLPQPQLPPRATSARDCAAARNRGFWGVRSLRSFSNGVSTRHIVFWGHGDGYPRRGQGSVGRDSACQCQPLGLQQRFSVDIHEVEDEGCGGTCYQSLSLPFFPFPVSVLLHKFYACGGKPLLSAATDANILHFLCMDHHDVDAQSYCFWPLDKKERSGGPACASFALKTNSIRLVINCLMGKEKRKEK